jgi:prepilin-type N-terminal cleavage/methylation domain-containing protein
MMIRGNISRGGVEIQKAALPRRVRGFSLIEMLIVIAVIGILAGLLLGGMPAIQEKRIRSQVRAELGSLLTHIEAYKEKHGFYPPDNPDTANAARAIAQPPLFYELVGTTVEGNPPAQFVPRNGAPSLTPAQVNNNFGSDGFMNSAPEAAEVKNFYTTATTNKHYVASPFASGGDKAIMVLRVPARGPRNPSFPATEDVNTWRYIVAKPRGGRNPTNNPNSFDLWAEVIIRGRTNVIGNWKEE